MATPDQVFTYGPSNVGSLIATTLSNFRKELADNIFTAIPLFAFLAEKKRVTEDGGATLVVPVIYSKNTGAQAYSGDDVLNTTIQDPFTAGQYTWKQYAAPVIVTGRLETIQNTGGSAVINYVKALMKHAEASLKDRMNIDIFAASVVGDKMNSLPVVIASSGTVGDINGTTNTWWQSIVTASGSFAARGLSDLRGIYTQITQRNPQGNPDFINSDRTAWEAYESTLVPQMRFQDTKMGDLGFENLKYHGATWVHDANCTSGNIFVIHSPSLNLVTHSKRNFVMSDMVKPINQDVRGGQLFWAGELVTDNRRKLGKMTGVTA